jgi:dethiobiotin synthetase
MARMSTIVVTGTDTDVGKTVFAAGLVGALDASYWKPVQAGRDKAGLGDSERVTVLSGAGPERIVPPAHVLATPCSPHRAAEIDGISINPAQLDPPPVPGPLVIEGAGGVLVPLTREVLYADLFARWGHPVVLVARTALGTINHSLLSLEALRARGVPVLGIAFVGEAIEDSEATIAALGNVKRLGRLPILPKLDRDTLAVAFAEAFDPADFRS